MLVLSRRVGESILIGNDIEITILKIDGGAVKIGITAPKSYKVYRKELYERIMKENIRASEAKPVNIKGVFEDGQSDRKSDKTSGRTEQGRAG